MTAGETGPMPPNQEAINAVKEIYPTLVGLFGAGINATEVEIIDRHFAPLRARVEELTADNAQLRLLVTCEGEAKERGNARITTLEAQLAEAQEKYDIDRLEWMHRLDEVVAEKRDVCELRRLLDNRDGLIYQIRSMLREAGFPDRIKMGEDLHGNEDWAPVRVEAQLKDAIVQLTAAQAVVRALEETAEAWGRETRSMQEMHWTLSAAMYAEYEKRCRSVLSTARAAGLTGKEGA